MNLIEKDYFGLLNKNGCIIASSDLKTGAEHQLAVDGMHGVLSAKNWEENRRFNNPCLQ